MKGIRLAFDLKRAVYEPFFFRAQRPEGDALSQFCVG